MLKRQRNNEIMERFVEQLEAYGLEIGNSMKQIESQKEEYQFFSRLKEEIEKSKNDFCSSYFALSESEKEEFKKQLLNLFKDQEIVDNILQEIINLYYLKEEGLLELEEVTPQKEIALENIETLLIKINSYLKNVNWEQLEADDTKYTTQLERLVLLGAIIEGDANEEIEDLDFLQEALEALALTEEEKVLILLDVIEHNLAVYQTKMTRKKKHEPIEDKIEDLRPNPVLSEECINKINELLSQKEIVERIVKIINDDFTMVIDIHNPTPETEEVINDSLAIAREEIMGIIKKNQDLTVEEAVLNFFTNFDTTSQKKKEILQMLTKSTVSTLTKKEQEEILLQAFLFEEEHLRGINELSTEAKEKIRKYMLSLYQSVEDRKQVYESQSHDTKEREKEAAYEIQVYRELLKDLPKEEKEIYAKVCMKIKEIFDCLKKTTRKTPKETKSDKHIFFITLDDNQSTLEEDLELGKENKGISSAFYGDINNQLSSIENRSEQRLLSSQSTNPGLKTMRKLGVRYTKGVKTRVFFIPVGKKDAIIIGASCFSEKDGIITGEQKIKKYQDAIIELKKRLEDPDTYQEEANKSKIIKQRIEKAITKVEVSEMISSDGEKIEKPSQKTI